MTTAPRLTVSSREGERLNGLGMMMVQYLEQNLADFEYKARQGARIRGRVSVEVEKGIAITARFEGGRIQIENGVCGNPDLLLKSSSITLSRVLSGKANLFQEFLRGTVKLGGMPRRPIQSLKMLRFLKIPRELLPPRVPPSLRKRILWASAVGLAVTAYLALTYLSD